MSQTDPFSEDAFFEALRATGGVPEPSSASAALSELWGLALQPQLARLLDALGGLPAESEACVDEFYALPGSDWLPPADGNSFDFASGEWFRRAALLCECVAIGATGSGDIWMIELADEQGAHRVSLLDHEVGRVVAIADSIQSFSHMCLLNAEQAEASEWAGLAGRVRGHNDVLVPEIPELAATFASVRRYAAEQDLLAALWFGGGPDKLRAPAAPPSHRPAELIGFGLRTLLLGDDTGLDAFLQRAAAHPARLVREAAVRLQFASQSAGYEARLDALGTRE